jgi:predicted nucleic acid-binding protein
MNDDQQVSFIDTNVLVYAVSKDDPARTLIAQTLLKALALTKCLRTSTQVLQEMYVTLTRKLGHQVTPQQALHYVDAAAKSPVQGIEYSMVREGIQLSMKNQISFWDALIVVAAARSGATRLYTEDLNHGQIIMGVEIVNPFRT